MSESDRERTLETDTADSNLIVARLERLLRALIGESVELEVRKSSEPCLVDVDPRQLEQAIVNLAINAQDAMPGGGRFTIEVENVHLDASEAQTSVEIEPGRYARLTFTDTGIGMDDETAGRVFEPFFTTKEEGTGLGLSTVYDFVTLSQGAIAVESALGKGTRFTMYLPSA